MTDDEMNALSLTDDQMEGLDVPAIGKALGADMGPQARRASRGGSPSGPRNYSDEEIDAQDKHRASLPENMRKPGIAYGPEIRERVAGVGPGAIYDIPRSTEETAYRDFRSSQQELGGDPTAQFVAGTVLSGGAGLLAGNIARGLGAAAPVARVAGAGVSGGTQAGLEGGNVATGAALGATLGAIPEVASAASRGIQRGAQAVQKKLRDPRGEIGRSIAEMRKAKASGVMDQQSFKDLPHGAPGFNQAASEAEEAIAARNEALLQGERGHYRQEQARIFEKNGDQHHLVMDSHDALNALEAENTINGVVADEKLGAALAKARAMLTTDTGVVTEGAVPSTIRDSAVPTVETVTAPAVKVQDLVKTKRLIDGMAEFGGPATPENVPYRKISTVLGKELEAIDPDMVVLNDRYHQAMNKAEETNAIMYGKDAADVLRTPAQQRKASGMLGRLGDNTQAATLNKKQIDRLRELDPEYAQQIDRVEAKKVFERTRFGMPRVSMRAEKLPFAFAHQNADGLAVRAVDPLLERLSLREPFSAQAPSPTAIAAGLGASSDKKKKDKRRHR